MNTYVHVRTHTHILITYIDTIIRNTTVTSLGNEAPSYPWKPMAVTSPVLLSQRKGII